MSKKLVFLNYNNPAELKDRDNQRIVNSHVGKYHRNRSKPAQRAKQHLEHHTLFASEHGDKRMQELELELGLDSGDSSQAGSESSMTGRNVASSLRNPTSRAHEFKWRTQSSGRGVREHVQILSMSDQGDYVPYAPQMLLEDLQVADENLQEDETDDEDVLHESLQFPIFSRLGQGRVDPFATYPVNDNTMQIHALVDFAVQNFWPSINPDPQNGVNNPVNNIYVQHMKTSPLAYYGYCLSLSTACDYLSIQSSQRQRFESFRARHIHATTRIVRKTLKNMPENPDSQHISDILLGSVLGLSTNHHIRVVLKKDRPVSRFRSPFAKAQYIDLYGGIPFVKAHWFAVVQMVNIKGGLGALGSPYVSITCQMVDLIDASFTSSTPMFPYGNYMLPIPQLQWPYRSLDSLTMNLTSSFERLPIDMLQHCNLNMTISAIAEVTGTLEKYYIENLPDSSWAYMIELRTRAHHMTLSLRCSLYRGRGPSTEAGPSTNAETKTRNTLPRYLFAIIRRSLLIYNNLVIYPMPVMSGVDVRLATSLKQVLELLLEAYPNIREEWGDLLLWSMILGGISDYYGTEREWYVVQCKQLLGLRPDLRKWVSLEQMLTSFLWLDFVLNEEAIKFWMECERINSPTGSSEHQLATHPDRRPALGRFASSPG